MSVSARPHVPDEELHAYADGQLSGAQRAEIAEHLLGCLICRAAHAEVLDLRSEVASLLAIASPRTVARPAARTPVRRWRLRPTAAIASIGGVAAAVFLALQPTPANAPAPRLATAFIAPAITAHVDADDSAEEIEAAASRSAMLLRRALRQARVGEASMTPVSLSRTSMPAPGPVDDADPAIGSGWRTANWDSAVAVNRGGPAHLDGVPVREVRMLPATEPGERPSYIIQHVLPDGRPIWIIEGDVNAVTPVHQLLEASGLSVSIPLRTRPDYVGSDAAPARTVRMISVAGYLPSDSLDHLAGELRAR